MKTLCFTGHRPNALYGYGNREQYKQLETQILKLIEKLYQHGFTTFITGGAQGADQIACKAVTALKKTYPEIKNILYLPCKNQDAYWRKDGLFGRIDYQKMLNSADEIIYINENYTNTSMRDRNLAMVNASDLLIEIRHTDNKTGGTYMTHQFAKKKGIPIININPKTLGVSIIHKRKG